jgi:hypothetical protein
MRIAMPGSISIRFAVAISARQRRQKRLRGRPDMDISGQYQRGPPGSGRPSAGWPASCLWAESRDQCSVAAARCHQAKVSAILFLCRRAGPLVAVWHATDMGRDVTAGFHEG